MLKKDCFAYNFDYGVLASFLLHLVNCQVSTTIVVPSSFDLTIIELERLIIVEEVNNVQIGTVILV